MKREERKLVRSGTIRAEDAEGNTVLLNESTQFHRVLFLDGTWSNWAEGAKSLSINGERLIRRDDGTLRADDGRVFTLPPLSGA